MTLPGLSNGLPDVSGNAMLAASSVTIIAVYAAGLFGLDPPPEVASAFTTLVALGAGLWKGRGFAKRTRHTDTTRVPPGA
jgi:hypothetical protein